MYKYLFLSVCLFIFGCKSTEVSIRSFSQKTIKSNVVVDSFNMNLYKYKRFIILQDYYTSMNVVNDSISIINTKRYFINKIGTKKLIVANSLKKGFEISQFNKNATKEDLSLFLKKIPLAHYHPNNDSDFYQAMKPFSYDTSIIKIDDKKTKIAFINIKSLSDNPEIKITNFEMVLSNDFKAIKPFFKKKDFKNYHKYNSNYLIEKNSCYSYKSDSNITCIDIKMLTKKADAINQKEVEQIAKLYKEAMRYKKRSTPFMVIL